MIELYYKWNTVKSLFWHKADIIDHDNIQNSRFEFNIIDNVNITKENLLFYIINNITFVWEDNMHVQYKSKNWQLSQLPSKSVECVVAHVLKNNSVIKQSVKLGYNEFTFITNLVIWKYWSQMTIYNKNVHGYSVSRLFITNVLCWSRRVR